MKRIRTLCVCLLLGVAAVLSGCGDPYKNVSISFSTGNSATIVLGETLEDSLTFTATINNIKKSMSDELYFSTDREILSIVSSSTIGGGSTRFVVKGLTAGNAKIKVQTLEGGIRAELEIAIKQPMKGFTIRDEVNPYILKGKSIMLEPINMVTFTPASTTEKNIAIDVKNLIELEKKGLKYVDGVISIPDDFDIEVIELEIYAYKVVDGNVFRRDDVTVKTIPLRVLTGVDSSEIVFTSAENQISSITLLSNSIKHSTGNFSVKIPCNDIDLENQSNIVFDIKIIGTAVSIVSKNVKYNATSVDIDFTLQTKEKLGKNFVEVSVEYQNVNYVVKKTLPIEITVIPGRLEINEKSGFSLGEFIATYTNFNSLLGTPIAFSILPFDAAENFAYAEISYDFEDDEIISLATIMGNNIKKPTGLSEYEKKFGRRIDSGVVLFEDHFRVYNNTTIFVKGLQNYENIVVLSAIIPLSKLFDGNSNPDNLLSDIMFDIPIKVTQGATAIALMGDPNIILGPNGEVEGRDKELSFTVEPEDSYTADFIITTNSTVARFEKTGNNTFLIIPNNSGSGQFTIILGNGIQKTFDFQIISNLIESSIKLEVENADQNDGIGFYDRNGKLVIENEKSKIFNFAIKLGATAKVSSTINPFNASIVSILYKSSNSDVISVNANSGLITGRGVGGQDEPIKITMTVIYNFAVENEDGTITIELINTEDSFFISGECYVPLRAFSMSKNHIELYDYGSVGFFNQDKSKALLTPIFQPANATYQKFLAYDMAINKFMINFSSYQVRNEDEIKNIESKYDPNNRPIILTNHIEYNMNTKTIFANKIGGETTSGNITFSVREYDNIFSYTVTIVPYEQERVEFINTNNCSEEKEIYLDANNRYFQILANAQPSTAYNRILNYSYLSPPGGGEAADVNVDENGFVSLNNSKGGRGIIRIGAQDSFISSGICTKYVDIPVRVADGTMMNPYSIRKAEDLTNISEEGLSKHYKLENNINLNNVSIDPLGVFTGSFVSEGQFTISGIKIDTSSALKAKKYISQRENVQRLVNENEVLEGNAARVSLGLFIANVGRIEGINFVGSVHVVGNVENYLINPYDIGLITGQNWGEINSCTVKLEKFYVSLSTGSEQTSRIGGMAGCNFSRINSEENSNVSVSMMGNELFTATTSSVVAGMMVGQNGNVKQQATIEWTKSVAGFLNQGKAVEVKMSTANAKFAGGIAGINYGLISNVSAYGYIFGNTNMGGLVGSNGNLIGITEYGGTIDNCISSVIIYSTTETLSSIGGAISVNYGSVNRTSVQIFDDNINFAKNDFAKLIISGGNVKTPANAVEEKMERIVLQSVIYGLGNLGGFVGALQNGIIKESYYVTFSNYNAKESNQQIVYDIKLKTNDSNNLNWGGTIGGFVGTFEKGKIEKSFTHAVVFPHEATPNVLLGSFAGEVNATLDNETEMIIGTMESMISNTYSKGYNFLAEIEVDGNNVRKNVTDQKYIGSFNADIKFKKSYSHFGIITVSNNVSALHGGYEKVDFDILNKDECWLSYDGVPKLIFDGQIFNPDAPTGIETSIKLIDNKMTPVNSVVKEDLVIWLPIYLTKDAALQKIVTSFNTYKFSSLFSSAYTGNSLILNGLIDGAFGIINESSSILTIDNSGNVILKTTGLAKIKIYSKFNAKNICEVFINVVIASEKLDIFVGSDFSSKLGDKTTILLKKGETRKLYAQTSSASKIGVNDSGVQVELEFKTNNSPELKLQEIKNKTLLFEEGNGFFNITGIAQEFTGAFTMVYSPKVQLPETMVTYNVDVLKTLKTYNHRVSIGASSMSVSQSVINTVPYFKNKIDITVLGDDKNEKIEVVLQINYQGKTIVVNGANFKNYFKTFDESFIVQGDKVFVKTKTFNFGDDTTDSNVNYSYSNASLYLELKEENKTLSETMKIIVRFNASNSVFREMNLNIAIQPILDVTSTQYTSISKSETSNNSSNILIPGEMGAIIFSANPIYSSFDELEIVHDSLTAKDLALNVIVPLPNAENGYITNESKIISNGISLSRQFILKLSNASENLADGQFKVSVITSSLLADKTEIVLTVRVKTAGTIVYEKPVVFIVQNDVRVLELGIKNPSEVVDVTLKEAEIITTQKCPVLIEGKEYALNFVTSGSPTSVEFIHSQYYTIFKSGGGYAIKILSLIGVPSNLIITVNISRTLENIEYTDSEKMRIVLSKAVITSAPVTDLDYENKIMRSPKGNSFFLTSTFDFGANIDFDFNNNDTYNKVLDLNERAGIYGVWSFSKIGDETWKTIGGADYFEQSIKINGKKVTILQNDIPFKFKFSIGVKYKTEGSISMPEICAPVSGDERIIKSVEFTFEVFENMSVNNSIPIRTESDLLSMKDGFNYILLNDIELSSNFRPLTAKVGSFNGNNKKFILPQVIYAREETNVQFALFNEVSESAIIQNVIIALKQDFKFNVSVGAVTVASIKFAGIAISNNGVITNCEVMSMHNISGAYIENAEPFKIFVDVKTTTKDIYVSGLVHQNGANGAITNSRVGASIKGPRNVAGFVYENNGKISSSSVNNATIENYNAENIYILSGFVGINNNGGEIFSSFVEGGMNTVYSNGVYSIKDIHSTIRKVESNGGNASSFIYENSGEIANCFANIQTISNNYAAGFIYKNKQGAVVKNAFSLSKMQNSNLGSTAFIGRDASGKLLNEGIFENCAYYMNINVGEEINTILTSNAGVKGLTSLSKEQFSDKNNELYSNFLISNDAEKTKGIWFIPSGQFEKEFKNNNKLMIFYPGRPHLVSPNIISVCEYSFVSYSLNENTGSYEYNYEKIVGDAIGSSYNPIIIFDRESFENEILNNQDASGRVTKSFRLVKNIDFSASMVKTYTTVFCGDFEGNGMNLSSIIIETDRPYLSAGLFATIGDKGTMRGTVKNLNIQIENIFMPNTTAVGGLAGSFYGGNVGNIHVKNVSANSNIIGRNLVGGVFGEVEINKNSKVFDIMGDIGVIALYQQKHTEYDATQSYKGYVNAEKVSYAGGVFGTVTNRSLVITTISDIKVGENAIIIGDNVGFVAGFVGELIQINNLFIEGSVNNSLRSTRTAGGIVGELESGEITNVSSNGLLLTDKFLNDTSVWPYFVGGVAGVNRGGMISNAVNNIKINVKQHTTTSKKTIIGGIVGLLNARVDVNDLNSKTVYKFISQGNVENCVNNARISGEEIFGGIVGTTKEPTGNLELTIAEQTKISTCSNNGAINSAANNQTILYAGGIVGSTSGNTSISFCSNNAIIVGNSSLEAYLGGIVGHITNGTAGDNNSSNRFTNIEKSFNSATGNIIARNESKGKTLVAGGIVGVVEPGAYVVIKNCYNQAEIVAQGRVISSTNGGLGGITGKASVKTYFSQCYSSGKIVNNSALSSSNTPLVTGGISGQYGDLQEDANKLNTSYYLIGGAVTSGIGYPASNENNNSPGQNGDEAKWVGKSLADLKKRETYKINNNQWDFATTWKLNEGSLPTLFTDPAFESFNFIFTNEGYCEISTLENLRVDKIIVPAEINGYKIKYLKISKLNNVKTLDIRTAYNLKGLFFDDYKVFESKTTTAGTAFSEADPTIASDCLPRLITSQEVAQSLEYIAIPNFKGIEISTGLANVRDKGYPPLKTFFYTQLFSFKAGSIPTDGTSFIAGVSGKTYAISRNTSNEKLRDFSLIILPSTYNGKSIIAIDEKGFSDVGSEEPLKNLKNIYLSENIVYIGESAFEDENALQSVRKLGSNPVNYYAKNSFKNCTQLSIINFDGLVYAENSFTNCTSLQSVRFTNSVTTIGRGAFRECLNIQDFSFAISGLKYYTIESGRMVVEKGEKTNDINIVTYANASGSTLKIGSNDAEIKISILPDAFLGATGLRTLTIGGSVISIQENAFLGCYNLTKLTFDGTSEAFEIQSNAFKGCKSLTEINMLAFTGEVTMGTYVFAECENVKKILTPVKLKTISVGSFSGIKKIDNYKMNESITTVNDYAFKDSGFSGTFTLGKALISWNVNAFINISGVEKWDIGDNTNFRTFDVNKAEKLILADKAGTILYKYASGSTLKNVTSTKSEDIVDGENNSGRISKDDFTGIKNIAAYAFENAKNVEELTLGIVNSGAAAPIIGAGAFSKMPKLKKFVLKNVNNAEKINELGKAGNEADVFKDNLIMGIYVPSSLIKTFKANASWTKYKDFIFEDIKVYPSNPLNIFQQVSLFSTNESTGNVDGPGLQDNIKNKNYFIEYEFAITDQGKEEEYYRFYSDRTTFSTGFGLLSKVTSSIVIVDNMGVEQTIRNNLKEDIVGNKATANFNIGVGSGVDETMAHNFKFLFKAKKGTTYKLRFRVENITNYAALFQQTAVVRIMYEKIGEKDYNP